MGRRDLKVQKKGISSDSYYICKKLYHSVTNDHITFTIIEGGGHNNIIDFEAFYRVIYDVWIK